jgi:lipopolysaccharide export system permease protein
MTRLDRYIARSLLSAIGMVLLVLLVLGGLFLFIDEQSNIGVGRYGVLDALLFTAMNLPRFALDALPAATLIGSMLAIGSLARGNEITVMRAAGMSRLRLVVAVLVGGLAIMVAALVAGEFVAPRLEQLADERKAFAKYDNVSFAGLGGAWIRDGNTVINVEQRSSAQQYGGMLVFELTPDNRLAAIGRAERATASDDQSWELFDYAESRFEGDTVKAGRMPSRALQSDASAGFLQLAVAAPGKLALQSLYRAISYRRANDLDASTYEFAFWSRIAGTVAILVAVAFAVPFGFGSLRSAGSGARMTLGLAIGIVYFFLQRMVESGALVFGLSPLLLAWLPTSLLALAAVILLARAR